MRLSHPRALARAITSPSRCGSQDGRRAQRLQHRPTVHQDPDELVDRLSTMPPGMAPRGVRCQVMDELIWVLAGSRRVLEGWAKVSTAGNLRGGLFEVVSAAVTA